MTLLPKKKAAKNMCFNPSKQLCFDCARACGLCDWSRFDEPIPGWTAIKSFKADGEEYGYEIIKCPLFVKEAETVEGRREQRKKLLEEEMYGRAEDGIKEGYR